MNEIMNETEYIKQMSTAVRPWASADARLDFDIRPRQKVPDQRDIDECLSCPKPECTNCKRCSSNRYGYVTKVG